MPRRPFRRALLAGAGLAAVAACNSPFDPDIRGWGRGFDTSEAALAATEARPAADARGIISYPTYAAAVAQPGDTVESLAARVGLPAAEVAGYNGLPPGSALREGEVVVLPRRTAAAAPVPAGTATPAPGRVIDVSPITGAPSTAVATTTTGRDPVRHRVLAGETAYSIARRYGVSVRALAEWNGLGADLGVREGQTLMIPLSSGSAATPAPVTVTTAPGTGSPTPLPPSAAAPLPTETVTATPTGAPASPDLAAGRTAASDTSRLLAPVPGRVIRPYVKKKNDGVDIAAPAGTAVRAADAGTVAAITRDTDGVPIVVVRHAGNLLTVYAGVADVAVEKGASVSRGQTIAKVRPGDPAFLHFEVREGFESVDPASYLN